MDILVTGAKGFIGKNLVVALRRNSDLNIREYDLDSTPETLEQALASVDAVFHLAGINRPLRTQEFYSGNVDLTKDICSRLQSLGRTPLIVFSSSTQASLDNPYGISKRLAEDIITSYGSVPASRAAIFRFPGVFGKWCRPNYNSVVATFCYNIARGLPIEIKDPAHEIELVYIDDVVAKFLSLLKDPSNGVMFSDVSPIFHVSLGKLAEYLHEFKECRASLQTPDLSDPFVRRLFATYQSYLLSDDISYSLVKKSDSRGTLSEVLRADGHGQFFISSTKAGVTRGNHYHDTKVEKFLVLEGDALIRLRNLGTGERVEYPVHGEEWKVIDIPPGWTHSIQNVGASGMIVMFWASEVFDAERPDTYPAEV